MMDGQVVAVTGGNGGIGLAIAEGAARAGADIAIWARDAAKSEQAAAHLRATRPGCDVVTVECDVADQSAVDRALERTVDALGRIDACVANAGTTGGAKFLDLTLEEWRRIMAVNLDGAFLVLQAAARRMVEQGDGGALLVVSSITAIHGAPNFAHYAASKAGTLGLVRSAAVALAPHKIRVNALLPGWTRTDLSAPSHEDNRFHEITSRRTPVRRWAEPEEFADVGAYLCDKSATFHTGDALVVDGGYTIY